MTEQRDEPAHLWHVPRLIVAWLVTVVFAVAVLLLAEPGERAQWWLLTIGVSALLTFALQLGTAQREGFINRTAVSIAGSVALVGLVELVVAILPGA